LYFIKPKLFAAPVKVAVIVVARTGVSFGREIEIQFASSTRMTLRYASQNLTLSNTFNL
jgi:hypothetical protein